MAAELSFTLDDQILLYDFLSERFSLDELKDLAFRVGINTESFDSGTIQKCSRGMITHCQRTNAPPLSCLVAKVTQLRPEPMVAALLGKLQSCTPNKLVQIVITKDAANYSVKMAALKEELARLAQKYPDEVAVLGVMPGSVKVLISLPEDGAIRLLRAQPKTLLEGEFTVESMADYDALPAATQTAWAEMARKGQSARFEIGKRRFDIQRAAEPIDTVTVSSISAAAAGGGILIIVGVIAAGLLLAGGIAALATPKVTIVNRCPIPLPPPEMALPVPTIPQDGSITLPVPPGSYSVRMSPVGELIASAPFRPDMNFGPVSPELLRSVRFRGNPVPVPFEYTAALGSAETIELCGAP